MHQPEILNEAIKMTQQLVLINHLCLAKRLYFDRQVCIL